MCQKEPGGGDLAYYQRIETDLQRYRNFTWYIPIWTVSFLGAAAAFLPKAVACSLGWQLVSCITIIGVVLVSIQQLCQCCKAKTENREVLRLFDKKFCLDKHWFPKWRCDRRKEEYRRNSADELVPSDYQMQYCWIFLMAMTGLLAIILIGMPLPDVDSSLFGVGGTADVG